MPDIKREIARYELKMSQIEDKDSKVYQTYAEIVAELKDKLPKPAPRVHQAMESVCVACEG